MSITYNKLHLYMALGKSFPSMYWTTVSVQPLLHSSLLQSFLMGRIPLKSAPFRGGICMDPHLTRGSLGPPESSSQTASQPVERFCMALESDQHTDTLTHPHIDHVTPCV